MKRIWKSIMIGLSFVFLIGCSSINSARVQDKVTISSGEKSIFLATDASNLNTYLYNYFDAQGWKIYESANSKTIEKEKGVTVTVQDRANFQVVMDIVFVDVNLLFQRIYNGYVTIVDLRTGKTVSSVRFSMATQKDIYKSVIAEFQKNVIIKEWI